MAPRQPYDPSLGMVVATLEHLERTLEYGLRRVEPVILPPEQVEPVRALIEAEGLSVSVHSPLCRGTIPGPYPLLASVFDTDAERREGALALMARELEQAADWGATHLTVHLQRSLGVLGEEPPAGWDEARAVEAAIEGGERLAREAGRVGVPLHIENMMGNPLFARPESYLRFFEALSGAPVRMCLDVGHAAFDAAGFGFGLAEFAAAVAPHVGSLHVYNNQVGEDVDFATLRESGRLKKHPVHPEHDAGQGWIDVAAVLGAILPVNPRALVTFEVYFALDVDRETTRQGLDWVAGLHGRLIRPGAGSGD